MTMKYMQPGKTVALAKWWGSKLADLRTSPQLLFPQISGNDTSWQGHACAPLAVLNHVITVQTSSPCRHVLTCDWHDARSTYDMGDWHDARCTYDMDLGLRSMDKI
jgi:hypothetical protein